MAYGGGGGDGGAADMRKQEEDRQAKVQAAVDAINGKFGRAAPVLTDEKAYLAANPDVAAQVGVPGKFTSAQQHFDMYGRNENRQGGVSVDPASAQAASAREAMYGDIADATTGVAKRDLDLQYDRASRANKFGLMRAGLIGSSVDAEAGGDLTRRYGEGQLKATQAGTTAAAELRNNDEKTRQNLVSLAQSGLDTGTASSLAAGQMGAAADLAGSQAKSASVGQLFDNMSQAYLTNQVLRARQTGAGIPTGSTGYSTSVFSPGGYTPRVQT